MDLDNAYVCVPCGVLWEARCKLWEYGAPRQLMHAIQSLYNWCECVLNLKVQQGGKRVSAFGALDWHLCTIYHVVLMASLAFSTYLGCLRASVKQWE